MSGIQPDTAANLEISLDSEPKICIFVIYIALCMFNYIYLIGYIFYLCVCARVRVLCLNPQISFKTVPERVSSRTQVNLSGSVTDSYSPHAGKRPILKIEDTGSM